MNSIVTELWQYVVGGIIGAAISLAFTILYTRKFEIILSKIFRNRIGDKSKRDISGLWVTQYKYPSIDINGKYFDKIETQLVLFRQTGNHVVGKTKDAGAHPEVFEGRVTLDRYFTGIYINTINHQNYHGAFQFIISIGKGRMKGRWIGFDNNGSEVIEGEWRWQQINTNRTLSNEDLYTIKEGNRKINLFDDSTFIM